MLLMAKSTISMGHFQVCKLLVYERVEVNICRNSTIAIAIAGNWDAKRRI